MSKYNQTEQTKRDNLFRAIVKKNMILQEVKNNTELAKRINIDARTIYRKLKRPDLFNRGETRRIGEVLNIPDEEYLSLAR